MNVIVGIIAALIIFTVLVIVHEGGHFAAAKAVGIRVNEFSIGMGPLIFQKQKGETQYSIRALPIGGYVAMEGEDTESEDERAFNNKPAWARALVAAAGPVMNFILAVLIFGALMTYGGTGVSNVIAEVHEGMPAYEAGIRPGDRLVSIGGEAASDVTELKALLTEAVKESETISVGVESPDAPGVEKIIEIPVTQDENGYYNLGVAFDIVHNPLAGLVQGIKLSIDMEKMMIEVLMDLAAGEGSPEDVVGPIGIVSIVEQSVKTGLINVIYLTALLSLNLALINMLPFPALDGGRLLFVLIRKITGKAVSDELEGKIHFIGMMFLFALMIFITAKDFNMFILKN